MRNYDVDAPIPRMTEARAAKYLRMFDVSLRRQVPQFIFCQDEAMYTPRIDLMPMGELEALFCESVVMGDSLYIKVSTATYRQFLTVIKRVASSRSTAPAYIELVV